MPVVGHQSGGYRASIPPKGPTCVWGCGRSSFNREHIISRNVAKHLGVAYPVAIQLGGSPEQPTETVLEGRVCEGCNHGWMENLDTRMVEFMGGSIREGLAARVELPKGRQERLGRWAVKIALLLQVWMHDLNDAQPGLGLEPPHAPADHFHKLMAGHPQRATRVWVGASPDFQAVPVASMSMANWLSEPTPSGIELLAPRGYHCVFTIRGLVFFLVGWDEGNKDSVADDALDPAKRFPGKLQQVWPAMPERVEWPPEGHLSSKEVARLIRPYTDWIRPGAGSVANPQQP